MNFLENLKKVEDYTTELESQVEIQKENIKTMKEEKQSLMDSYGITNSNQQEALRNLTDEQKESLNRIDESIAINSKEINSLRAQIHVTKVSIFDIKIDKMKSHEMVDAKKAAKQNNQNTLIS